MRRARAERGIVLAGGLGLLWALAACPAGLVGQTGRPEVVSVRFRGNDAFPDDSLALAIVTRQTECRSVLFQPFCWAGAGFAIQRAWLPRREFLLDPIRLKVWYQQRGYREANIDTETSVRRDGKVSVTFLVKEGRPVRVDSLEFVGTEELAVPELLRDLPLRRGAPLSVIAMDATRDTLTRRLTNQGYARAEVLRSFSIARADPYAAVVTFDMDPGLLSRYGHVSVEGNEELSVSTVLRTIQFRSGDVYRASQLQDAQARLFGLELIRSASVTPDFESGPDSVIPVAVRVQEGDLRRVRAGAGWSSSECMDVDARWVHRNFLGGGRRVQVRGRVSNILARDFRDLLCWDQSGGAEFTSLNWIASVDFAQPWIFSTRNAFQASLYAERQSLPDVFVREAVGLSFALTRSIRARTSLALSYRPELSRLDAAEILFCTSFLVCTPEDISVLQAANWLAPAGLTLTRNAVNNVLNPSRGYTLLADVEHGDRFTGSAFTYTRIQGDMARFARLPGGSILAGRVRLGWVSGGSFHGDLEGEARVDMVHPQKRFYAGGANSVRGYPQSRLGPRVLTTDPENLLQPLARDPSERGGAGCTPESIVDLSCDAAPLGDRGFQARPTGGTTVMEGSLEARIPLSATIQGALFTDVGQVWNTGADVDPGELRFTPGFGIRYLSPIGPLRVDFAYRFAGGESLTVITNGVRPFVAGTDDPDDRLRVAGEPIPWMASRALASLSPRVFYDVSPATSLRRWQIHISIGQAF
ncbi:MAG TPA: BamA/TamA family outer membrane protein [Longimicrobiales bacterium]|nr:BamA/TamA family outer membrane protein [Longimicrobiales bacterium]